MTKLLLPLLIVFALLFSISSVSFAQSPQIPSPDEHSADNSGIPEKEGDYPDPKNPGVRVRVFVYKNKEEINPKPIISCTDPDSSAVTPAASWHLPSNFTYNLNTASVPNSLGSSFLPQVAANSFNTWSSSVGGKVQFVRGSDTTLTRNGLDNQNIVAWGRTQGSALAVTYTRYFTATGEVADIDTIFNKKFSWTWTNPAVYTCSQYSRSYDAQNILTHELGHWMGLDDTYTSAFVDNTMYGYGSAGEIKKNTLTTGDINGVSTVYP